MLSTIPMSAHLFFRVFQNVANLSIFEVQMKENYTHKTYTVKEATLKLMQFCAYRDRSHKEVAEKLSEMRMIPAACEQIIVELMQEGFLNEERFARSFARGKFRIKKWGRIKIRQELKRRDISEPIIRLAMTEIDEAEYQKTLEEVAEKKRKLLQNPSSYKQKKKLIDFLLRKGYESHLVIDLVNQQAH